MAVVASPGVCLGHDRDRLCAGARGRLRSGRLWSAPATPNPVSGPGWDNQWPGISSTRPGLARGQAARTGGTGAAGMARPGTSVRAVPAGVLVVVVGWGQ
jgi:hypothetical protein